MPFRWRSAQAAESPIAGAPATPVKWQLRQTCIQMVRPCCSRGSSKRGVCGAAPSSLQPPKTPSITAVTATLTNCFAVCCDHLRSGLLLMIVYRFETAWLDGECRQKPNGHLDAQIQHVTLPIECHWGKHTDNQLMDQLYLMSTLNLL